MNSPRPLPKALPAAWLVLAALSIGAAAVAARFTWQPGLASLHDDSVSYLVMAQAFAPFHAASAAVMAAWPYEKYPPAFPLLIAVSGGAFDWRIAHALVAACFGASVFMVGVYARLAIGSAAIAVAAAAAYALLPGSWLLVKGILSEFPYIALAFAALALYERHRREAPSRRSALALGLLLARSALSQMDVPTRTSYVMAVVTPAERAAAASVTAVPRSLASSISPALAGMLLSAPFAGWPLIACGCLKIAYDLGLLLAFRHIKPPEEMVHARSPP